MYKYKNSYIIIFSFMNNIILCLYNFKTLKQLIISFFSSNKKNIQKRKNLENLMCVYFIKLRNNLYLIYIKIKV